MTRSGSDQVNWIRDWIYFPRAQSSLSDQVMEDSMMINDLPWIRNLGLLTLTGPGVDCVFWSLDPDLPVLPVELVQGQVDLSCLHLVVAHIRGEIEMERIRLEHFYFYIILHLRRTPSLGIKIVGQLFNITFISGSPINKLWGRVFITGLRQWIIGSFPFNEFFNTSWDLEIISVYTQCQSSNYSFLMLEPDRETFIMTFCWILSIKTASPGDRIVSPNTSQSLCKYFNFYLIWDQWTILLSWRYFTTNKCIGQWE